MRELSTITKGLQLMGNFFVNGFNMSRAVEGHNNLNKNYYTSLSHGYYYNYNINGKLI